MKILIELCSCCVAPAWGMHLCLMCSVVLCVRVLLGMGSIELGAMEEEVRQDGVDYKHSIVLA